MAIVNSYVKLPEGVCIYIYKRVLSIIYHAMIMIMVYVGKTSWDVMVRFLGQNADGKKWWCDGDIIEKSHDLWGYGGMKTIKHMEINVSTIVTWIYLIIIWEYSGIKQKRKNTQVHNIYWEHSRCFFFRYLYHICFGWIAWPADCQRVYIQFWQHTFLFLPNCAWKVTHRLCRK